MGRSQTLTERPLACAPRVGEAGAGGVCTAWATWRPQGKGDLWEPETCQQGSSWTEGGAFMTGLGPNSCALSSKCTEILQAMDSGFSQCSRARALPSEPTLTWA